MLARFAGAVAARSCRTSAAWAATAAGSTKTTPFSTSTSSHSVTPLTSDAEASRAMAGTAVLDFTAAWCGPCRAMKAPFAALAAEHAGSGVAFHTVDIDDDALLATVTAAGVSAVPTFAFYKDGEVVGQVQGADLAAVRAAVEELVKGGV